MLMSNEQEEWKLAEYLSQRITDRGVGRDEPECLRNYPRDVYFIGNLRPLPLVDTGASPLDELLDKLAPMAFGADFSIHPSEGDINLNVTVKWVCYYRVFPTLSQQREHQQHQAVWQDRPEDSTTPTQAPVESLTDVSTTTDPVAPSPEVLDTASEDIMSQSEAPLSPEVLEAAIDRRRSRTPKDSLFVRFRKLSCEAAGQISFRAKAPGEWTIDASSLQTSLDAETERAQQQALADPEHIRTSGGPQDKVNVPETALVSQADYQAFLSGLATDVVPTWKWQAEAQVSLEKAAEEDDLAIFVGLVNVSPMSESAPNSEAFLFDTRAIFHFNQVFVQPFDLELAPKGFRYDSRNKLWGRGFNCAVEVVGNDYKVFTTTHTPNHQQMRYQTRSTPRPRFDALAQNPIPTLVEIFEAMRGDKHRWQDAQDAYARTNPDWQAKFQEEFASDQNKFSQETEQFRRGCQMIRENADVRLAFELTNETFRRMGDHRQPEKKKEAWRLFQIVFFVSQIPAIAALSDFNAEGMAEREIVDIVYFPTGGGKTEAYLAVVVFHCFFDRLRGKTAGVTTWTRFPLRLLTLQQTQRFADVIGLADLLRREQDDTRLSGSDVDGFAVGYFVGQGGSPNEIDNPELVHPNAKYEAQPAWSKAGDVSARQEWKRIISCPSCRTTTVEVEFDPVKTKVLHRCTNAGCAFPNGEIPVFIVDNEVYRYLPSVMVGTIDKLAGLGNQRKLSLVFGQVDGRCSVHGYYKGKCCQKDCTDARRLKPGVPVGISGPTLFVQDELHLLKEGLGTFDAHYETFIQQLRHEFGQTEPLKIIASSATIEAFARQVEHLYGRDKTKARVFPCQGPTLEESFYAETMDFPQRIFTGIIPHNKTIFNAVLELIEIYHREIQSLQRLPTSSANPYGGTFIPGTEQWKSILDLYATSLTYFLGNRELNSIRTDIAGDVSPNLQHDGLEPLEIYELTGSTTTEEVSRTLEHVSNPSQTCDTVLATSMVSHGVDIDRFNAMFFYGMPRQNAEYIQASSRVGRSHVGLVFACLHPGRERDRSHYTYFVKFHEFLGQLVEPVAINRWSKFSINRTLPGLFMAVLLQRIANSSGAGNPNLYYMIDFVTQKISTGELQADDFIPMLQNAYLVNNATTVGENHFDQEIKLRVQQFLDQILEARPGEKMVSNVLIPKPLMSLRDVDEAINIELDNAGTQWASRNSGS